MKQRTRKFLAGLLSLGMLLQAASPLSALAADDAAAAGTSPATELTVTFQAFGEDTTQTAEINQETTEFTLDDQTVKVSYEAGTRTYTFDGCLGKTRPSQYGPTHGDEITVSGTDTVHPNVVWTTSSGWNVTGGLFVENVNNFTGEKIYGNGTFTCDGDVTITSSTYAILGRLTVKSAQDVTVTSSNVDDRYVAASANITCSGKVTLRNEGKGQLTNAGDLKVTNAAGVELYCKDSYCDDYKNPMSAYDIILTNCSNDVSIINETEALTGDGSLTVSGSNVQSVTVKGSASGSLFASDKAAAISAKSLSVQNTNSEGSVGTVKFTKPTNAGDYKIVTGTSAESSDHTEKDLTESPRTDTYTKGYLSIEPGKAQTPAAPATEPTLELTFDPEHTAQKLTLTGQSDGTVTASGTLPNDIISTSYDSGTKTYTIKANFAKDVILAGTAADGEAPSLKLELQSGSTITPQNVNNVEIRSSASISIDNHTKILGDLDIQEVHGSIWMGGTVAGKLNINGGDTCTDIYMQPFASSTGYIFQSITVNAPAAKRFRLIGADSYGKPLTRDGITVTAKQVILDAPSSGTVGIVNFTAPDNRSYAAYTDYQKSTQIDVPALGTDFTGSYLQIDVASYPSLSVKTSDDFCLIETDGTKATVSSPLYGTLTNDNVTYDVATNTFTIYDTHFAGESGNTVEIIGIADGSGTKPSLVMKYENNPLVENGGLKVTNVQDFTAIATLGVANTLTVEAAGEVSIETAPAPASSMDITAAGLTIKTYLDDIGNVKFTPADTGTYKAYTDEAKTASLEALPTGDAVNSKYLRIEKASDDTTGGNDSGSTGGNTGDNDSGNTGGNTGSDDSGSTGGNTGSDDSGSTGNDDSGNTGSDTSTEDSAGGAVAAVLMGGAAVWGGYEVVTRVILHELLPEGAAIPTNRGELAALVWNTAGRPEPAAAPAFADIADPDTAKAAQWCVEQGLMDAKSEDTFKPDGWVPKFRTIEVWNQAFPKN